MCRHLGYLGPTAPVGDLLTRGPRALRAQAWAPREMRGGGTINADGFGVAWWAGGLPARYRNAEPIWADPAVEEVLPQLHSTAVLAAVRSATVGMPVERSACAPFLHGRWAFSHNGVIPDWQSVLTDIAAEFGSPALLAAEARTDSATLWVILCGLLGDELLGPESSTTEFAETSGTVGAGTTGRRRAASVHRTTTTAESSVQVTVSSSGTGTAGAWGFSAGDATGSGRTHEYGSRATGSRPAAAGPVDPGARPPGPDPVSALRRLLRAVLVRAPAARLNLLLGDGDTLWASTVHHSLSALVTAESAVLASEPYDDDPGWRPIADRQLVLARPGRLAVFPIDSDPTERARS